MMGKKSDDAVADARDGDGVQLSQGDSSKDRRADADVASVAPVDVGVGGPAAAHQNPSPQRGLFDPVADVAAFHEKFGQGYHGKPRFLNTALAEFRLKFMREEISEYEAASTLDMTPAEVLEQKLDALVDEVYVVLGTAYLHGFDFREAWRRVHEANMRKACATSAADSKRGYAGDIVKPPGWVPPSHADLVADYDAHSAAMTSIVERGPTYRPMVGDRENDVEYSDYLKRTL